LTILPTPVFFYGMEPAQEISVDLERGKTLIVRYVGDVRTYEARWTPGDSNLSDPGHPRRVAIRRRRRSRRRP